jgi:beta-glucanase (GH16 family)
MEARLKLPKGKGTWPAFWMMPKNYVSWPGSGEIDIMEEVGYNPNYTSSSIHCDAYNHTLGTQKTAEVLTAGAQDEFHVYALEWTADYIKTYVDGKQLLYFANDKQGKNATWPFSNPFYIKLNLAWGGDWGGAQGVDESCLPATYEIDYVRVFQKK